MLRDSAKVKVELESCALESQQRHSPPLRVSVARTPEFVPPVTSNANRERQERNLNCALFREPTI